MGGINGLRQTRRAHGAFEQSVGGDENCEPVKAHCIVRLSFLFPGHYFIEHLQSVQTHRELPASIPTDVRSHVHSTHLHWKGVARRL